MSNIVLARSCCVCGKKGPNYSRGHAIRKWTCSPKCRRRNLKLISHELYLRKRDTVLAQAKLAVDRRIASIVQLCSECGSVVDAKSARKSGQQATLCSDKCRRSARRRAVGKWSASHPENVIEKRAALRRKNADYFKKHYAKHRERKKKQTRAWYAANSQRANETARIYNAAHPELIRHLSRKSSASRRALKKQVFVEVVDPKVVFKRDKGVCGICRRPVDVHGKWEIDHVIPISKGGAHAYDNVQLAHRRCNRSKGNKLSLCHRSP